MFDGLKTTDLYTACSEAVSKPYNEAVEYFIREKKCPLFLQSEDLTYLGIPKKYVLLTLAVGTNNRSLLEFLIASGADINEKDHVGLTALTSACRGDDFDEVKFLVEKGTFFTEKNCRT